MRKAIKSFTSVIGCIQQHGAGPDHDRKLPTGTGSKNKKKQLKKQKKKSDSSSAVELDGRS